VLGTPYYGLWPLASLMAGVSVDSTEAVAERIVQAPLPDEERRELVGQLVLLAGLRLRPQVVTDVLRRNPMLDDLLKDNSVADILRQEGALSARRQMAQEVLEGRFGPLSEDMLAALRAADEETLRTLAVHLATDTLEQMRARLGLG
jgi:hypothetical protein